MRLRIVYDNEALEGFIPGWGFSCMLEGDENVLFDTGGDAKVLLHNMERLSMDPSRIDKVVISHNHLDHAGSLPALLELNENIHVFVPPSADSRALRKIARRVSVTMRAREVSPGMTSTGPLGTMIEEQGLVVSGGSGNVLVVGCAHPGLERMLQAASRLGITTGVVGGFHSFSKIERLEGLHLILPCHCTRMKREILARFPQSAKECAAGRSVAL